MDRLLDSFRTVFGNGFLKYFKEQDKKHKYLKLDDYQKVIQRFIEDEQFFRTNYYSGTHVHFTRFLFVSIENFKINDRTINFTELDHKGKLIWQLEHIIPQSKFEPGDSDKNKLGNLTLLHGDINVKYQMKILKKKRKLYMMKMS